ncbi:MAG: polyprenyl synthetase family protein [bacterium]
MSGFEAAWESYRQRTERALASRLGEFDQSPARLREAMEYACLNGGKRFRAMLAYACGEIAGAESQALDALVAAVEMIHAYSLIHDDLPAMDDDDLRRGRPSCHVAYDQATAILAGDALQSAAFETLSCAPMPGVTPTRRLRMIQTLARAIGARGMVGGQALDIEATGTANHDATNDDATTNNTRLARIHRLKTGALIRAAAGLGGLAAPRAEARWLARLDEYAACLGLAFQIADDLLDESASETSGKPRGADRRMQKSTWVSIFGAERARAQARDLSRKSLEIAASLGDNPRILQQLARFAADRRF